MQWWVQLCELCELCELFMDSIDIDRRFNSLGFVKVRNGTKSHCLLQLHHQLYSKLAYTSGLWLMLKFSKGFALACSRRHLAPGLRPAAPGAWPAAGSTWHLAGGTWFPWLQHCGGTWELACWWHLGTWPSLWAAPARSLPLSCRGPRSLPVPCRVACRFPAGCTEAAGCLPSFLALFPAASLPDPCRFNKKNLRRGGAPLRGMPNHRALPGCAFTVSNVVVGIP